MIARTPPILTAAVMVVFVCAAAFTRPRQDPGPGGRLTGLLYSIDKDTQAARATAAEMPELDIGLDPAARAVLPPAQALVVRFVGIENSTFTLTLARRLLDTAARPTGAAALVSPPPQSAASKKPPRRPKQPATATTKPQVTPPPAAVAVTPPAAMPPPPATPTFPPTFAEIDDALRGSSTVKAINVRLKKDGVTFRLTHVGRVGERYVVRYAIANEEASDFFLSIVNVTAGGKPIHAEQAGPYSCPASQEVFGVTHFLPAAVAGKKVVVELVQGGGNHRRYLLPVDYAF